MNPVQIGPVFNVNQHSAVVAFLTAMHELGYRVPVSVAASHVRALCDLKRKLMERGIPETDIGLKHSSRTAPLPSTGSQSRLIQLVTHARVRGGTDFHLFGEHLGAPRALMIYDETLLRADASTFEERDLRKAVQAFLIDHETRPDPLITSLAEYLRSSVERIQNVMTTIRGTPEAQQHAGHPVELDFVEEGIMAHYIAAVRSWGDVRSSFLESFLGVSQEHLQALAIQQGGGVIAVQERIPPQLRMTLPLFCVSLNSHFTQRF